MLLSSLFMQRDDSQAEALGRSRSPLVEDFQPSAQEVVASGMLLAPEARVALHLEEAASVAWLFPHPARLPTAQTHLSGPRENSGISFYFILS